MSAGLDPTALAQDERVLARNVDIVRAIVRPLLAVQSSPGVPMLQNFFADPGEAAVYFDLVVPDRVVRVQVSNADPSKPALVHTKSFTVVFRGEKAGDEGLNERARGALRLLERTFAARDLGNLGLEAPAHKRGGPNLLLALAPEEKRQHPWSRERFASALRAARAGGVQTERAVLVVSQPCEMQCVMCPQVDRDKARDDWMEKGDEAQLDDLVFQLRLAREAGARHVEIGGNDVLRFSLVLPLLETAGKLGYEVIKAQTPGPILGDGDFAERLAATPITHVTLPLYGTTAAAHDAITGTPGAFDRVCRGIDKLRAIGRPEVEIHTIAFASTLGSLVELVDWIAARFGIQARVTPLRPNRLGEREHLGDAPRLSDLRAQAAARPQSFRREFPLCVLPLDVAAATFAEHEPGAPAGAPKLHLWDLGAAGVEQERVRRDRTHFHPEACRSCALEPACPGLLGAYLEQYGASELRAVAADELDRARRPDGSGA